MVTTHQTFAIRYPPLAISRLSASSFLLPASSFQLAASGF